MRKMRNKNRKPRSQQTNPAPKRRKTGPETFTRTCLSWISQGVEQEELTPSIGEKRKDTQKPAPPPSKRIKMTLDNIRNFLTNQETAPHIKLLHHPTNQPTPDESPCSEQLANPQPNATVMPPNAPSHQDKQDQEYNMQQLPHTGLLVLTETKEQEDLLMHAPSQDYADVHQPECNEVWENMLQLWREIDGLVQLKIAHPKEDPPIEYQLDGKPLARIQAELTKL